MNQSSNFHGKEILTFNVFDYVKIVFQKKDSCEKQIKNIRVNYNNKLHKIRF